MSYNALRKGRHSDVGRAYFVTVACDGRRPIFLDFALGRLVVLEFRRMATHGWADTLAFVIMPDHFHWLFTLGEGQDVSSVMRQVKGRSARSVNHHLGVVGAVW